MFLFLILSFKNSILISNGFIFDTYSFKYILYSWSTPFSILLSLLNAILNKFLLINSFIFIVVDCFGSFVDRKISFSIIEQGVIEIIEELKIKEINKPQEDGDLVATKGDVTVRLISRIDATDAVKLEDVKFIPRELIVQADNPDDPIFQAYKEAGLVITDEVITKLEKELIALLEIAKKSKHVFKENVDLLTNLLVYIKTNKNELTQDLAKTGRAKIIHDLNSLKTDDKTKKARIERLIDSITVIRHIEVAPVTPGYASAKPDSPRRFPFKQDKDKKFGK